MNYKGFVNEFCQKNKLLLPQYDTKRVGGHDHDPIWESRLTLLNKTFMSTNKSKIQAETNVAKLCYDYLQNNKSIANCTTVTQPITSQAVQKLTLQVAQKCASVYNINFSDYQKIVFVDVENCEIALDQEYENILFLFFCAKNTTRKTCFGYQNKYKNCFVFVSQSVAKDAADHLLTFNAGIVECLNKMNKHKPQYYIITKDHYGECLEKFMDNCHFVCSISDVFSNN